MPEPGRWRWSQPEQNLFECCLPGNPAAEVKIKYLNHNFVFCIDEVSKNQNWTLYGDVNLKR